MSGVEAISAVNAMISTSASGQTVPKNDVVQNPSLGFGEMIASRIQDVELKIETANNLVQKFAIDDTVPIHQVTIALEEARLAVELTTQVRSSLLEGYREIMNMQL